jgi:DNA-binding MarR family transcriptional regulator
MGTALTRLADLGLVEKKAHLRDRRQLMVKLTAKGIALRKSGKDASRAWLGQAIARLERREQAILFNAGQIIQRLAEPQAPDEEPGQSSAKPLAKSQNK